MPEPPSGPMSEPLSHDMSDSPAPSAGSLLVIDDEPGIRESLALLLQEEGFDVTTAATGEAGMRCLAQKPFDLVLLDVALPDKSGLDEIGRAHV